MFLILTCVLHIFQKSISCLFVFTKKSTSLFESTTLPMRKKGEKTVAPRGPTPSFSRDVGENRGEINFNFEQISISNEGSARVGFRLHIIVGTFARGTFRSRRLPCLGQTIHML